MIICQGKLKLSCLSELRSTNKPIQSKVALNILHIFIETYCAKHINNALQYFQISKEQIDCLSPYQHYASFWGNTCL